MRNHRTTWQAAAYLFMLLPLTLGHIGCGGHPKQTQKTTLSFKTSTSGSNALNQIEELVVQADFETAAQRLKDINIGMTSVEERDRLLYLTARIALGQKSQGGCELLANYAQTSTDPKRKQDATRRALRCLKAPNGCLQIVQLADPLLKNLNAMSTQGLLKKRLRCNAHEQVVKALVEQQGELGMGPKAVSRAVGTIILGLDGVTLKKLLPLVNKNASLRQQIGIRLVTKFLPLLSQAEQKRYVSELPPSHPVRVEWEGSARGTHVLICLPLTGKFGSVGKEIQKQLKQLAAATPIIFAGELSFMDCDKARWSELELSNALTNSGINFVLSLTDKRLQLKLSKQLEKTPEVIHFTLNPIYPGASTGQNTWTLNVAPELLIGTVVTDVLSRLNRSGSMPLPLRVVCVTNSRRNSPIKQYLQQYTSSFDGLEVLHIPETCEQDTPEPACAAQTQDRWINLARKVSELTNASNPFEVLYLDLSPDESVSFLKYFRHQNIELDASGKVRGNRDMSSFPFIYSDHRAVHSSESHLEVLKEGEDDRDATRLGLRNRFTRLAGDYSSGIRFLVHFNPLSESASSFSQKSTEIIGKAPKAQVITLAEALKFIDAIVKKRRQPDRNNSMNSVSTMTYQGHTAGLSWAPGVRSLPRLRILTTQDGYFIER